MRLNVILRDAFAGEVHEAQVGLGLGETLLGGAAYPRPSASALLWHSVLGLLIGWKRAMPTRSRVNTSKSFVLHFLSPFRLLGYDNNVIGLDDMHGEYL